MEVKVDSERIKSERARRAWTQEHLATLAGVSLRTVQRIEKTGTASPESVRALASALSLEVVDLQPDVGIVSDDPLEGLVIRVRLTRDSPLRFALLVAAGLIPVLYAKRQLELGIGWDIFFAFVLPTACLVGAVVWSHRKFRICPVARAITFAGSAAFIFFVAANSLVYVPPI